MIGRKLSHYELLAPLGAGGMGQVYRARDAHLEREVAIKVLPDGALADEEARWRFRREALALSRLAHPHINVVHDFDHDAGVDFLVMELIQGETLEQRLENGPLPEPEIVRLGGQIASALSAAHEQGVIHRDLKPSNIMVTARGEAKVLDFGIAKQMVAATSRTTHVTEPFAVMGTAPYMAPEQLLGKAVDARSDLFSLGAVLYEMSTGRRPFDGVNAVALMSAILNETPPAPRSLNPAISTGIEAVILRCLEKSPERRFSTAEEVARALTHPPEVAAPKSRRAPGRAGKWLVAAGVSVVAIGLAFVLWRLLMGTSRADVQTLAVMPLQNLSNNPDQQFFVDGMTDELIIALSQVRGFRVIARSSTMVLANSNRPIPEIAKKLNASAVITGSVQRWENRVRLRAQLVQAKSARTMWGNSFERDVGDVFAMQSDLVRELVEQIRGRLEPADRKRLASPHRIDPAAHEHYLRGRFYVNQFTEESWQKAVGEFQQAIDLDPTFALAYVGLADAYSFLSGNVIPVTEAMPRARAAITKALDLSPELSPALASLGYIQCTYERDWRRAEATLKRALEIQPNEITALQNYGLLLQANGRFDEALSMFRRARELDPLSPYVTTMSLWPLNQGRRYKEAIAGARQLLDADSSSFFPRLILAQSLAFSGQTEEAVREFERVARTEPSSMMRGWLGWSYGRAGRTKEARAILDRLTAEAKSHPVQSYAFALVQVGLGMKDEALASLERGVEQHGDETVFMNVDPAWDPLRSDPRFQALLRRMRLV